MTVLAVEAEFVITESNECPGRVRVWTASNLMLTVRERKRSSGRWFRKGLDHVACYKILTANPVRNFTFSSTNLGCGGILNQNFENKAIGVAGSLETQMAPAL